MSKPTVSTMDARLEWVKMFYPDAPKGIVVGVVHLWAPLRDSVRWVLYRRTDDTQRSARLNSPMGLDVGTFDYLRALQPAVADVHFWPEGSPVIYRAPLPVFGDAPRATVRTTDGRTRTRIFLPTGSWVPLPAYADVRPDYWDVTHLHEDGGVIARYRER